jgi:hypothetical protein
MRWQKVSKAVTPAEAGVQKGLFFLDSGFRRNDTRGHFLTFYETVNDWGRVKPLFPGWLTGLQNAEVLIESF